jgi:thiamine pyrophosphokinase
VRTLPPGEDAAAVRAAYVPDAIVGDLDSIRPEVLSYYTAAGATTHDMSHDQDTTDLHKAITAMVEEDAAANGSGVDGDGGEGSVRLYKLNAVDP